MPSSDGYDQTRGGRLRRQRSSDAKWAHSEARGSKKPLIRIPGPDQRPPLREPRSTLFGVVSALAHCQIEHIANSAGMSGSRGGDDFAPRLQGRCPEGSARGLSLISCAARLLWKCLTHSSSFAPSWRTLIKMPRSWVQNGSPSGASSHRTPRGIVTAILACGLAGGSVAKGMKKISYSGYRFPPEIIQQAIWLYLRFTLSFRDVEDLLAERGIMVSYETVRRWVNHFGPKIAADLRKR